MYLCRCADSEAQSFPSRNTIGKNCSISLTSVKNAMRELLKSRLLVKEEQFRSDGSQTSNLYTIFPEPYECESAYTESKTETEIVSDAIIDSDNNAELSIVHSDLEEAKYALPQLNINPHAGQNTPSPRSICDPYEVLPNLRTTYQEVNKNSGLKRKYKIDNNTKLSLTCDSS